MDAARTGDATDRHARLAGIMARLATGDGLALFDLLVEFAGPLRAAVRRSLDRLQFIADVDLTDELVMETALVVQAVAPSWSPEGGALPWVWAEARVHARISAYLGQHHDDLDNEASAAIPDRPLVSNRDDGEDEWATLRMLAAEHPELALLEEALMTAATTREQLVLLPYEALKADGDPSPARTLAVELDLSPDNVRQIVRRAKVKVRKLVDTDDRYASIRDLPILR